MSAKPPKPKGPVYTVVKIETEGRLTIIDPAKPARNQEVACDQVVETLPPDQRTGHFAAFLTGSFKDFNYDTVTKPVTSKKPGPGLTAPVTSFGESTHQPNPKESHDPA